MTVELGLVSSLNPVRFAQAFALTLGQGLAEVGADFFGEGFQLGDNGGLRGQHVGRFAGIVLEIEELRSLELDVLVFDGTPSVP